MSTVLAPPPPPPPSPRGNPPHAKKAKPTKKAVPFWLRKRSKKGRPGPRPTPRDIRWWFGVVWLLASAVVLGFILHVAVFGALQHNRSQAVGYDELRTSLAKAETPLGQLGINEKLVPEGTPVALVAIPKLGLTEVVRQGTSGADLRLGAGHRRDTVMPGQEGVSMILGRQAAYGGPFGGLASLVPGDTIEVTTGQSTHDFTVLGLRRAGDPLPEVLADGKGRLELVTADGPALAPTGVLYVDADLTGTPSETPAAVFTQKALSDDEAIMASDSSALLPLLFTFQWLAVAVIAARWLSQKWGRWQTWIVASPVLLILGASTADNAMALLPNLI